MCCNIRVDGEGGGGRWVCGHAAGVYGVYNRGGGGGGAGPIIAVGQRTKVRPYKHGVRLNC